MGLSGGLALFWKSDIKIKVHKSFLSHIDALVEGVIDLVLGTLQAFMETQILLCE